MAELKYDAIDRVIKETLEVMENSKYQVFEICENTRLERDTLLRELQELQELTTQTIDQVDKLEIDYKRSRIRLTEVSRDFQRYKEEDIKVAYEVATSIQMQLTIFREKEAHLKKPQGRHAASDQAGEPAAGACGNGRAPNECGARVPLWGFKQSDENSGIGQKPADDGA